MPFITLAISPLPDERNPRQVPPAPVNPSEVKQWVPLEFKSQVLPQPGYPFEELRVPAYLERVVNPGPNEAENEGEEAKGRSEATS